MDACSIPGPGWRDRDAHAIATHRHTDRRAQVASFTATSTKGRGFCHLPPVPACDALFFCVGPLRWMDVSELHLRALVHGLLAFLCTYALLQFDSVLSEEHLSQPMHLCFLSRKKTETHTQREPSLDQLAPPLAPCFSASSFLE